MIILRLKKGRGGRGENKKGKKEKAKKKKKEGGTKLMTDIATWIYLTKTT